MKLSKMVKSYMAKLTFRTTIFIVVLLIYFFNKDYLQFNIEGSKKGFLIILVFCIIMFVEMLIQINPKSNITKGCLKQFKSHYKPFNKKVDQKEIDNFVKDSDIAAVKIVVVWTLFNLIFGYLYKKEIIRDAEMIVLTSFYYLADLLCVMFFCPFQKYIMKNRCCITCRIFAWGLPMMTFPLVFIESYLAVSVFLVALAIAFRWEYVYHKYPERFFEKTNVNLQCANCGERMCIIKKPLKIIKN